MFVLLVACVHLNEYGMVKQKPGVIITTFECHSVDWGIVMGATLREGLNNFHAKEKLYPIIQQYFTILFPPTELPALGASRPSRIPS